VGTLIVGEVLVEVATEVVETVVPAIFWGECIYVFRLECSFKLIYPLCIVSLWKIGLPWWIVD